MPSATANRLLPLLGGGVVLMLVFVTLKSSTGENDNAVMMESVPTAPAPDADTPADTIKTLTANVAAMTSTVEALRRDNDQLRQDNQALVASRTQIEANVATRLRGELLSRRHEDANQARLDAGILASLTNRVDSLAASLAQGQTGGTGSDLPVGLGLDGIGGSTLNLVWVAPLHASPEAVPEAGLLDRAGQTAGGYLEGARTRTDQAVTVAQDRVAALQDRPVYTVPRNATLIGSTAMTALIGRIPIQGQVRDPMPFKVITGAENLAANGLTVSGGARHGVEWHGGWRLDARVRHRPARVGHLRLRRRHHPDARERRRPRSTSRGQRHAAWLDLGRARHALYLG